MKGSRTSQAGVEGLVSDFAKIGIAQDRALLLDDIAEFNRLYAKMEEIVNELRSQPGDQRRALLTLYDHSNMQVRLAAARATLAISCEDARKMIETIASSGWMPQAGDAGMTLSNLDRGIFKPT